LAANSKIAMNGALCYESALNLEKSRNIRRESLAHRTVRATTNIRLTAMVVFAGTERVGARSVPALDRILRAEIANTASRWKIRSANLFN